MNKILTAFLLIFTISFSSANDLKKALQGTWLCTKILDQNGQPTNGKFGASDEYLKFKFKKSKLLITEAPFDPSMLGFTIKYGKDFIDLIPGSVYKIPEQVYFVKEVDSVNLILSTLTSNNDSIFYHFVNQNYYNQKFDPNSDIVDLGLVVIKHLKLKSKGANRVSDYIIPNREEFLYPSPTFIDNKSASFGHYFSINFKFPDNYPIDSVSAEMIIDFDIQEKEIKNFTIVQGVDSQIDSEALRVLQLTREKWRPITFNNEVVESRVRLHFVFYLGKMVY